MLALSRAFIFLWYDLTMSKDTTSSKDVLVYQSADGGLRLPVTMKQETIWLSQADIARLFFVQKAAISKHIKHIYEDGELKPKGTVSILETVAKEGKRTVRRNVEYYNLDMVLSVGYRVNSKQATQFRVWATQILHQHLLKGFTLNERRLEAAKLQELRAAVSLIRQAMTARSLKGDEAEGLLKVITDYTETWTLLEQFDQQTLDVPKSSGRSRYQLTYEEALELVAALKKNLVRQRQATDLFGTEQDEGLKRIIGAIQQPFDPKELHPSVEEKAAHLLYSLTKNQPFVDGNKRIAAFLFIVYLTRTEHVTARDGERKFSDSTLVALVLLIAESKPEQKNLLIKLITNFVHGE